MKNLNQIRARNAMIASTSTAFSGKNGGEVVKKIPPVIINNGLISALAYAQDLKNEGWSDTFAALEIHLRDSTIALLPEGKDILGYLLDDADSTQLRMITDETLAWLSYLRRFAKKEDDSGKKGTI